MTESQKAAQFKPGSSGNPGGRGKGTKNIFSKQSAIKLSKMGADPLEFLGSIMIDENEKHADRMRAAESILAYAYSKQPVISEAKIEGAVPVMNVKTIDLDIRDGLVEDAEDYLEEE